MIEPIPGVETHSVHRITVPLQSTIDEPSTPSGAEWYTILRELAEAPGWSDAWWGRRTENLQEIDLLIGWSTYDAACAFFSSDRYVSFAAKLQPLLSQPLSAPYAVQLMPSLLSGVAAYPEGVTTMYSVHFSLEIEKKQRQKYENRVGNYAEHLDIRQDPQRHPDLEELPFLGQTTGWALNLPESTTSNREADIAELPHNTKATFIILVSWSSVKTEATAEQIKTPGKSESLYEHYVQSILDEADLGYDRRHVQFDFLSPANLNRKERSSTILGRAYQ